MTANSTTESYHCNIGNESVRLNAEQYKVVMFDTNCHIVCQACAGSGKTTTLTTRIANMIHNKSLPAKEFLVVTFTRNAAKEMTKRIKHLIGDQADNISCGTFHSIAYQQTLRGPFLQGIQEVYRWHRQCQMRWLDPLASALAARPA